MTIKTITFTAAIIALMASGSLAQAGPDKQKSVKKGTEAAASAKAGKAYIHKPDSTMYHPGNGVKNTVKKPAAAKSGKAYIHKPDSTMYHPGNGVTEKK
ncbi:MAG: hypothetical protein COB49_11170 [Alphaproteobacteria bacterium]|nr:MAG: hypothetical protein COB49_11170 [Alphaproteobacteria bacterium]